MNRGEKSGREGDRREKIKSEKVKSEKIKKVKTRREKTKREKVSRDKISGKKEHRSIGRIIKLSLKILLLLALLSIVIGILYFYQTYGRTILQLQKEAKELVRASTPETFRAAETSLVYDAEGNLITVLKAEKDVYYIRYEDIPQAVVEATLTTEDKKFMYHDGVDYLANVRAAIALIKHKGEITQGASTITQQLARNIFLTHEVTYERKIKEIFIAQELEKKYSKAEILEYYFNNIYFANGHYGILAAANGYFNKGVNSLSLSQTAFLCAIPNNPNLYNPLTNMENTLDRRDRILLQLYEDGIINLIEYRTALAEKIELSLPVNDKNNYVETYIYHSAIRSLMRKEGFDFRNRFTDEKDRAAYEQEYNELYYRYQKQLYTSGYRIYTSIDLHKQELLQNSVDEALAKFKDQNEEGVYQLQGAAVCIDNDTGRVVAIVGGRRQELEGYTLNRAYQSYRQPGSAIKPLIVYTPAFERGYYPDSTVKDEKFEGGPKNSGGNYLGDMKLQRAIELSKNTVAWKLFEELTPQVGLAYLFDMKFMRISETDYVPAAALGGLTIGTSPLEMASAYATLQNDGIYRQPSCIVKIMDVEGNEIVDDEPASIPIYQTKAARITTEALTGVIERGTAKELGLTNTISAGKTGTTDDRKDGWFVGYTPYYTTSVWVGYDMPKELEDLKGSSYPGTIWHNFMEKIHDSSMTDTFRYYDWRTEYQQILNKAEAALEAGDTEETEAAQEAGDTEEAEAAQETGDTEEAEAVQEAGDTEETEAAEAIVEVEEPEEPEETEAEETEAGETEPTVKVEEPEETEPEKTEPDETDPE